MLEGCGGARWALQARGMDASSSGPWHGGCGQASGSGLHVGAMVCSTSKRGRYLPPLLTRGRQPCGVGAPSGVQIEPRTQAGGTAGVRAILGRGACSGGSTGLSADLNGLLVPLVRPRESEERHAGTGF